MPDSPEIAQRLYAFVEAVWRPAPIAQSEYRGSMRSEPGKPWPVSRIEICVNRLADEDRAKLLEIIDKMSAAL